MKRIVSLLLCLLLLLPALPVRADESADVVLRTAEDWADFARACVLDSYSRGKVVSLANDIALTPETSIPAPLFAGTFCGNGCTVSGFTLTEDASVTGLFRQILPGASVESLRVAGTLTPGGLAEAVGGVAGENHGTLLRCSFSGTVKGRTAVGGVVGRNASGGVLEGCAASGSVSGEHRVGGIAGENSGALGRCRASARVNTEAPGYVEAALPDLSSLSLEPEEIIDVTDVGGIAGFSDGSIEDCTNLGSVGYPSVGYNVGGIVGRQAGYTAGCVNSGAVCGRKDVGGIAGQLEPDARWSFSQSKLSELRADLDALQRSLNTLGDDTAARKAAVSARLATVLDALERADGAARTIAEDAMDWTADNMETLNELTGRAAALRADLVPVADELAVLASQLPPVADKLERAAGELADTASDASDALEQLSYAVRRTETAAADGVAAVGTVTSALETMAAAILADPSDALSAVTAARTTILGALALVRNDVTAAANALETALNTSARAADGLSDTADTTAEALALTKKALETLQRAAELTDGAVRSLGEQEALRFRTPERESAAREELYASLDEVGSASDALRSELDDTTLSGDLRAITDKLFTLTDFLVSLMDDPRTVDAAELVNDVSTAVRERSDGTILNCKNTGAVAADTNAGGVAGAVTMELAFDRESRLDLSSLLAGGAQYLVYAALRACVSQADVSAKKSAAGGIAGRMDFGAASACAASGSIRSLGDWAGGVAGYCAGTLESCLARATISAGNYAGGIVGQGKTLYNCSALPRFEGGAEYLGSIAGTADGTLAGNRYAACESGGVNGFSFSGQAEPCSYDELLAHAGASDLLRRATVRFVQDGEIIATRIVPYGTGIDTLPAVRGSGGRHWVWDAFDRTRVTHDLSVAGHWVDPIPTLATAETPPLFLAEGAFGEEDALTAEAVETGLGPGWRLTAASAASGTLRGDLVVHLHAAGGGTLYVDKMETAYTVDGSYLVFSMPNGAVCVYLDAPERGASVPRGAIGGAGGAAAFLAAGLALRARKKRRAAAQAK